MNEEKGSDNVEEERTDIGEPQNAAGVKCGSKRPFDQLNKEPVISATSKCAKNEVKEHGDKDITSDLSGSGTSTSKDDSDVEVQKKDGFYLSVPSSEDEMVDVDGCDDEVDKGPSAAEILRAQLKAEQKKKEPTSAPRGGSTKSSSGSTKSSDNESCDKDSINQP